MEPENIQNHNYPDIFFKYFFNDDVKYPPDCPEHVLIFVFSGELTIYGQNRVVTVVKGGYVFLHRDENTRLIRKSIGGEPFSSVFMGLRSGFLNEYYYSIDKGYKCHDSQQMKTSVIELTANPYLESLYISLLPYVQHAMKPIKQILEIKMMEAVLALLLTNENFYASLFSSTESGIYTKLPVKKPMCYLYYSPEISEYYYSCCSPVFNCSYKYSHASAPWQCKVTKELETTYIEKHHTGKLTDIYMEIDYKLIVNC